MNRKVATAVLVSLVIVGLTLILFLRRDRPAAPSPSADVAAARGEVAPDAERPFEAAGEAGAKTDAARLRYIKLVILRVVGLLLLAGQILYATKREERI